MKYPLLTCEKCGAQALGTYNSYYKAVLYICRCTFRWTVLIEDVEVAREVTETGGSVPASTGGEVMEKLHEQVLYPCVRVQAGEHGGSGTVIYSKKHTDWHTYILTCHHVVEKALVVKEKWDSFLGRMRKVEERDIVRVEFFHYEHGSRAIGTHGVEADIVMHDTDHDVALLRLRQTSEGVPHVATLFPYERTREISLLDPCFAVGCALLHAPIVTAGYLTSMSDHIDGKSYWMSNAQIIFGNSGGAVFHGARNEFIGIPSRVAVVGWGTAVTHMGYFSDVERIYTLLDAWCYDFIYNEGVSFESCTKAREMKRREDLELQKRGFVEV